jgi:sugar O-acyltransferase (sialic acid O-acetyltransferase NeuD family)
MGLMANIDGAGPQPLLIFPCNGNGLEALHCLGSKFQCLGFIDDSPEKQGSYWHGYRVFDRTVLKTFKEARVLAVPGGPTSFRARKEIINGIRLSAERFASVIHPRATISPLATIGHNVLIMAGVVVTSNCIIGNHVCVLPNTVLHHDVVIGDWTLIGSNVIVAGGTAIQDNCFIGSGSSVKNGLVLETGTMIDLGSNLINNVPTSTTVAGNPARLIR